MGLSAELELYRRIVQLYRDEFIGILEEAKQALSQFIEREFANETALHNGYSVTNSSRFTIRSRVKGPDSLLEKLTRTSQGLELIQDLFHPEDVPGQRDRLRTDILRFKDALGLKVICDLQHDADMVFSLIKRKHHIWTDQPGITLQDLETQPQTMENGRPIYRIKGTYHHDNHLIGLEIQIKSRLNDAWGEIEHPLFYKNYQQSLMRGVLEEGMNNVGRMLDSIDEYLYRLRVTAERNLLPEAQSDVRFYAELYRQYCEALKGAFGHAFSLKPIQAILFHCNKEMVEPTQWAALCADTVDELEFVEPVDDSERGRVFRIACNNHYHIRVMFAVLHHWRGKLGSEESDRSLIDRIYTGARKALEDSADIKMEDASGSNEWFDASLDTLLASLPPTEVLEALTNGRMYRRVIALYDLSQDIDQRYYSFRNILIKVLVLVVFRVWDRLAVLMGQQEPDVRVALLSAMKDLVKAVRDIDDLKNSGVDKNLTQTIKVMEEVAGA